MPSPPLFRRATVSRIVQETADARTFTLEPLDGPLTYKAGQYCIFRIVVDGRPAPRAYSFSSAPGFDEEITTTVKRVPGGAASNWLHDHVREGDELELTAARGRFTLRSADTPLLGFCGGSGITPVLSLAKSALAGTDRRVRLLCADRDRGQAIFHDALGELAARHPGRLDVVRHLDDVRGYLTAADIKEFVGADAGADAYVCGPEPFMELVESTLAGTGRVFSERFGGGEAPAPTPPAAPTTVAGSVTVIMQGRRQTIAKRPGETLLQSARRAGFAPPFSCEAGNCATCMAVLREGTATMRANEALMGDEVAEGYVLTCQAVPDEDAASVVVEYE
ncbi:2Fe-2S iron-sulfur cluster-binding protein [Streptomyces sp. UC4497]